MNLNTYKTQNTFSKYVKLGYQNKCAICRNNIVEACHIIDQSLFDDTAFFKFAPMNGILLCPNHHTAYDYKSNSSHFMFDITKRKIIGGMLYCTAVDKERKVIGKAIIHSHAQQLLLWRYYIFVNQFENAVDLLKRLRTVVKVVENILPNKTSNITLFDRDNDVVMADAIPVDIENM